LLQGFAPTVVYRGHVRSDYIGVEDPRILGSDVALVRDREYLLVLRPSKASKAHLRKRQGGYRKPLSPEEVLAIIEP